MRTYIDVILPLPLWSLFTYALPQPLAGEVKRGSRVVVPFGKKKLYTAIVQRIHTDAPQGYEVKEAISLLDAEPILLPAQLTFWQWIADYYLCTLGDVYKAALPSGLKLESETIVVPTEAFDDLTLLSQRERTAFALIEGGEGMSVSQLAKATGLGNVMGVVKGLLEKGAVGVQEELKQSYRPRMEKRVRLTPDARNEHRLHIFFDELQRRAPKQLDLLIKYLDLSGALTPGSEPREVSKQELLARSGAGAAIYSGLVKRGVLEEYLQEVGRLGAAASSASASSSAASSAATLAPLHPLGQAQRRALDEIHAAFSGTPGTSAPGGTTTARNVCLLHGVTASGKTEIYMHLIDEQLRQGRQVLYLLPEIALTTQITQRLQRVFGSRLGVYHSKFPDAERVEIWKKQLSDEPYDLILGVRSSVFLPFQRLGLVIVDEEHEGSFKQQDPAPRYHARNAALVLAAQFGAKTLLGTATPSLESWYNATVAGKYALVQLKERYRQVALPRIVPVDIKELQRTRRMEGIFSPLLLQHIRQALGQKEQVILFQNRRGFAPMIECHTCGWVPKCMHCDVSLTFHKGLRQLTCHYCGYTEPVPLRCPACEGSDLRHRGFGTEKIEDTIQALFPEARVARMDLDTTRTRQAFERIISDFQQGRTDILVGTQMVSKGLDFEHVSVVGILYADTMLNYPDFRAYERAFQMMAQVAGRAGRSDRQGTVILQTRSIDHPILAQVMGNHYEAMAAAQLAERELFHYPPFHRLIYVYLKHRDEQLLDEAARTLAARLRDHFGSRLLGPDKPPVSRIQTLFIRKMMLKVEVTAPLSRARELLVEVQKEILADPRYKSLLVYYDVDPM
ncbi:MAG: primosomal protein N' [Bacteroides sp.]